MFRWYSSNKEWLTNPRLKRMMTRLLRRAAALNPTESDDFSDSDAASPEPVSGPSAGSIELAAKVEQMTQRVEQVARELSEAQRQLEVLRQSEGLESRVNASLGAHHEQLRTQANLTNQSLQLVVSSSEQLAGRLSKAEKLIQGLKASSGNCSCPSARAQPPPPVREPALNETDDGRGPELMQRLKWEVSQEIEQLQLKLQLTAGDLEKSIHTVQTHNEGALRNFSASFQESMKEFSTLLDDKLSTAATASYDVITNTTLAFGEDLQVLRQAVSSSASQVQFLVGQDMKTMRGLEEVRSNSRRHENNIQVLTTQLGEFKLVVQDQLNSIRNHFTQAVNEFYQKIVERQNSMTYRLGSVVDDLQAVKNRSKLRQPGESVSSSLTVVFICSPQFAGRRRQSKQLDRRRGGRRRRRDFGSASNRPATTPLK